MNKPQSIIKPVLYFIATSLLSLIFLWVCSNNGYSQGAGYALDFDGVDDNILVASSSGDELNPQTSITVECWINLNEVASSNRRHHMVSKWGSYGLIIETNGHPRFYIYDGNWYDCQATTVIKKNKWYHIAGSYDGNDVKIYVNGILEGTSTPGSVLLRQNSNPVRIGTGGTAPVIADFMYGKIDEVRIWDTANTITKIQQSMNQKVPGSTSNLVGYWRLDDNSGTNAADLSPYGNNGTLTNMTPLSDWVTSNAPIGDGSIFPQSANIRETTSCEVDVTFGTGIGTPGADFSIASIQINELPNNSNGLLSSEANLYWEIWSEDLDFEDDFTSTVNFHYDNITGILNESLLVLYKRDSASALNWLVVPGFTVFTDDGGSSTISDGIGYIQIPISEVSSGGFNGQYILSWNDAPVVLSEIPDTSGTALKEFIFKFDSLTFGDFDVDDSLSYSAALITGDLPDWLSFNDTIRTFSGTPESDDTGIYSVIVTAIDRNLVSVTDTFEIHITGLIGIVDLANEWNLNIYPNPSNGIFYINLMLPENKDIELKIFTITGQLIMNEKHQYQNGDVRLTINLSDYRKDVYIVKIVTKSGEASKQLIIQ